MYFKKAHEVCSHFSKKKRVPKSWMMFVNSRPRNTDMQQTQIKSKSFNRFHHRDLLLTDTVTFCFKSGQPVMTEGNQLDHNSSKLFQAIMTQDVGRKNESKFKPAE